MLRKSSSLVALLLTFAGCTCNQHPADPAHRAAAPATRPTSAPVASNSKEQRLFDGKTLKNWKVTDFGGEGPAEVEDGKIVVSAGVTLSGVNWTGPALPKDNYEIELDAMKLDGSDFFLGLTFPYKDDFATIVLGGWGGSMVGISSVNGFDAANNEWATAREFKKNQWYHVRLRCTPNHISAWLDNKDEPFLDLDTEGKEISTRADIDAAKPLGLSTYQTSAAYKNIVLRKL
jgi:hypothetical protein